jgi:cytochrome c oxidase cbb3-type subunit 2
VAGFLFISLAIFVQGVLPLAIPESRETRATRAVRTETGEVKWVWYESSAYTPVEERGRRIFTAEGCWYCHSQYVRPVAGEDQRWGPVSQVGEYAHDWPHLLSTRRIGPDLTRVGLKVSDGWHYAHHWRPRMLSPDSIMPDSRWLFRTAAVRVAAGAGGRAVEDLEALRTLFTFRADRILPLIPNPEGVAFAADTDGTPALELTGLPGTPETWRGRRLMVVVPTDDLRALVAYAQKLGTNRGAWRDAFDPQRVSVTAMSIPASADGVTRGKIVYAGRCAGCHGVDGDGHGPAATFLEPRPRDFTTGVFKFRSTPSGSLPTDGDLYRTITRGVRGTAMPTWHELPEKDRLAVITYVKTFSPRWREERAEVPVALPDPPGARAELLQRGKALYGEAKCAECHGENGQGDGPSAPQLRDDVGFRIRPTDFRRGQFKGGSDVRDVFRALSTGLDGTPMPSFADAMTEDERWAISYYVLSLSAFRDPLTGERLRLGADAMAALNAAAPAAFTTSELALDPSRPLVPGALPARPATPVRFFRGLPGEGR